MSRTSRRIFSGGPSPDFTVGLDGVLGIANEPIDLVQARVDSLDYGFPFILWERDPETHEVGYISQSVEEIFGYPVLRWLNEPNFWSDVIVHGADREDARAFLALATAQKRNHYFQYWAMTASGEKRWIHDSVKVFLSERGVPIKLRGLMVDITQESHF